MCHTGSMNDEPGVPKWSRGDRLRKARMYAHLEQDDIAAELGVSRQTVSRWENDDPIKRAFAQVWAVRCGVPFEWVWDEAQPAGVSSCCRTPRPWEIEPIPLPVSA